MNLQLAQIRTHLLSRHAHVLARAQRGVQEALELGNSREPDFLDEAAAGEAVSMLGHMGDAQHRELLCINLALRRIASGQWGVCRMCQQPIAPKRLLASPEINTCIVCAALP